MRLVAALASVGLALGFVAGSSALAQSRTGMSGVWVGYYGYDGQPDRVQFQAKFAATGASFTGAMTELNSFGDPSVIFLTSTIAGETKQGGALAFTKTYDGTGGQSHAVPYIGTVDASGLCIVGTWKIDATGGPFKMCADARLVK